jgi:hypothetical protein
MAENPCDSVRVARSRIDKLGLKPGMDYEIAGDFDRDFQGEASERAGPPGSEPFDMVFVRIEGKDDLDDLVAARKRSKPNAAIWAIWPKGKKALTETHIRDFALANGLVDVKVMSFSPQLSGLKLVIPLALRP